MLVEHTLSSRKKEQLRSTLVLAACMLAPRFLELGVRDASLKMLDPPINQNHSCSPSNVLTSLSGPTA